MISRAFPLLVVSGLLACSSSSGGGGSDAGAGAGGGGAGGGGSGGTSAGGSGGGSSQWCGKPVFPETPNDPCEVCLNAACCSQADACAADTTCAGCVQQADASCSSNPAFANIVQCVSTATNGACAAQCGGSGTGGGGGGGGGPSCKPQDTYCSMAGECCLGLVCCEQTTPPSCLPFAACQL